MEKCFHLPLLVLLCIGLVANGCQSGEAEEEPLSEEEKESAEVRPEVIFAVADDEPIYQYVESQGIVEANQTVQIKPKISGYVEQSYITEGRRVSKGDSLLAFDRFHRPVGDDLGYIIPAILFHHIINHFLPAVIIKVNICIPQSGPSRGNQVNVYKVEFSV